MRSRRLAMGMAALAAAAILSPAQAQDRPPMLRDSFSIGSAKGVLCQVQDRSLDNPSRKIRFDRA